MGPSTRRAAACISCAAVLVLVVALLVLERRRGQPFPLDGWVAALPEKTTFHPIDLLILEAAAKAPQTQGRSAASSVDDAAAAYRARRGRHPPPHFDKWLEFAHFFSSATDEPLFDQIYHDLEPFWAVPASSIRHKSQRWRQIISIRDGQGQLLRAEGAPVSDYANIWLRQIEQFAMYLPDMDIAINDVDEPRVIVPWEDMDRHFQLVVADKVRRPTNTSLPTRSKFSSYAPITQAYTTAEEGWNSDTMYLHKARRACHPDSPGRAADIDLGVDRNVDTTSSLLGDGSNFTFVRNWTMSKMPCENPRLFSLQGNLISPLTNTTTSELFPLFTASKVQGIHNDILLPGAEYFRDGGYGPDNASNLAKPWTEKKPMVYWRGSTTGGALNETTWRHCNRMRYVAMLNGSSVEAAERLRAQDPDGDFDAGTAKLAGYPQNFPLPDPSVYGLGASQEEPTQLGAWTSQLANASFTWLMYTKDSHFLDTFYEQASLSPFDTAFDYKYLPDIDGQAFSARFRSFLCSTSLAIKSTIYTEWHDARLVPWYHFVPMDTSYADWWSILEYFAGYSHPDPKAQTATSRSHDRPAHEQEAREIAEQGRAWGSKALRREDMLVYMFRLLLEYGRVSDDNRFELGWAQDMDER